MNDLNTSQANHPVDEDEISLIDLLTVVGLHKKFIFLFSLSCALISVVVSLLLTPVFTAKTVFMPPQQQSSSTSSLLSSLGGLSSLAAGGAGIKTPDEMYLVFLKSDGVLNRLIEQYDLKSRYKDRTLMDARKSLLSKVKVLSDKKSSLLSVEVDDEDPTFAATLANAFVTELSFLTDRLAVTDAQQRRKFFEIQIQKTQEKLAKAEEQFRISQGKSGFQMPSINADTSLRNIAELHGQIAAREIQLQAIDRFATQQNPQVQRLTSELTAMRMTLQKLELGSGVNSLGSIQQEAMSYYREMKIQESMLEAFVKQLELARVDEAKEGPLIQVVDVATPPERRSSPKRALIVLSSVMAGLFLSLLIVFIRQSLGSLNSNTEEAARFSRLKSAWGIKA